MTDLYKRVGGTCVRCGYCCSIIYSREGITACRFLDDNNNCKIYKKRPQTCKDYPTTPNPLNPECGYKFKWIGDKIGNK